MNYIYYVFVQNARTDEEDANVNLAANFFDVLRGGVGEEEGLRAERVNKPLIL